jgi:predicted amidohydrolase YtcJ
MAPADLVFVNGTVFTGDPAFPRARALAVSEGVISALGDDQAVLADVDRRTEVLDLAGRMLLPGFRDAHVHPIHGGLALIGCDLSGCEGPREAVELVAAHAARLPDGAWVKGRGWAYDWFDSGCPDAELLDQVVPDRPVYLVVRDGHSAWVNQAALRAAGITRATPDPPGGRIERRPDGTPQGTLHEAAMSLVEEVMPPETEDELDRALQAGIGHLVSCGVTGFCDPWVTPSYHRAYRRAAERGDLPLPVRGALWWDREAGLDQIETLVALREEGLGLYRPGAVKLMLDGVIENRTASVLEPYTDGGRGMHFIDPGRLPEIVASLDRLGFQCHFHAIGDAAVRSALDAVETARARNGFRDLRHTIAHLQLVAPEDIPRFRRLGVVANCQPLWACRDEAMVDLTVPALGPDRVPRQYPFGSLHRTGAVLAMGSDWPVSTSQVPPQLWVATRRTPPDAPHTEPLGSDERLDLSTCLTAFTAGSAYLNHSPSPGVLQVGNVADLVVLDRDPFEDLGEAVVDLTVVAGRILYER